MILLDRRKLAELADRAAKLDELTQHPAWGLLRQLFEAKRERWTGKWVQRVMAGEEIEQRKLDYMRGYWAGVGHVLANPEQAMKTAEQAIARAEALAEEGEE